MRAKESVARMKRSEMRDLPAPGTKTRIALRSIRATLACAGTNGRGYTGRKSFVIPGRGRRPASPESKSQTCLWIPDSLAALGFRNDRHARA